MKYFILNEMSHKKLQLHKSDRFLMVGIDRQILVVISSFWII